MSLIFLQDAFSGTGPLTAHSPTIGLGLWTLATGFDSVWEIDPSGEVWLQVTNSDGGHNYNAIFGANASLQSDVSVSADFKFLSSVPFSSNGLCINCTPDGHNGYFVLFTDTGNVSLYKIVAGSYVFPALGSVDGAQANCTLVLEQKTGSINVYRNGVQIISVVDTSFNVPGYAGLWAGGTLATLTTGIHAKNISGTYFPGFDVVTQEVVEAAYVGTPAVRLTQEAVEVEAVGSPFARVTQDVVEVAYKGTPNVRMTQMAVELLVTAGIPPPFSNTTTSVTVWSN